eukprot:12313106-Alexandrium_andersonii.AAC.1
MGRASPVDVLRVQLGIAVATNATVHRAMSGYVLGQRWDVSSGGSVSWVEVLADFLLLNPGPSSPLALVRAGDHRSKLCWMCSGKLSCSLWTVMSAPCRERPSGQSCSRQGCPRL